MKGEPEMERTLILTSEDVQARPARERVGLVVSSNPGGDAATQVKTVIAAEAEGVRQVWSTQSPVQDTLTAFAAAAVQTRDIRLGTAIIPTYSRHPLTMVAQALALDDLAPGRLRLGVGSSHRPIIEGTYGIKMVKPLQHLREYVQIVRAALWKGKVDHQGIFFTVNATLPRIAQIPLLTSALRENAFKQAGEIADGVLCWNCPVPYLLKIGLPALRASAQAHGRPVPPLVAHVLAAVSEDRPAVLSATRVQIQAYRKLPFYASMFADAGYPVGANGTPSNDLIASLVISGGARAITERFKELLSSGLDELMVQLISVKQTESELHQLMQLIGRL
ncbi:MAG: LLM class flavin-dependent oxidoreductase [Candidatus Nitrosopolaris sp.]|jgi:alkanesulfonate monooxygenase SsuD/methylene tetrahydromethanopterin reductase-like flavin-dependent oxidoreductase (luciferase family)